MRIPTLTGIVRGMDPTNPLTQMGERQRRARIKKMILRTQQLIARLKSDLEGTDRVAVASIDRLGINLSRLSRYLKLSS